MCHYFLLVDPKVLTSIQFSGQSLSTVDLNRTCLPYARSPHPGVYCFLTRLFSKHQHKHFNTQLNNLKTNSSQPGYASGSPLAYNHLYLTDSFYPSDDRNKIRVTRDDKKGEVLESMKKIRLGDLNIYSPKRQADWRISVNLEVPGELTLRVFLRTKGLTFSWASAPPPVGTATHSRKKDRMSYSHEEFKIDLTQVTVTNASGAPVRVF